MKIIVMIALLFLPITCIGQDWYIFPWNKNPVEQSKSEIEKPKTQKKCKTTKNKRGKYIKKCYIVKNRSKYNGKRVPGY